MAAESEVKTPQQALADAYRLDDDAPLGGDSPPPQPAASSASAEPPVPSKPTPPKDPITGRFLPAGAPAPGQHPQRLIRLANELGMDEAEIAAMPDTATLEQVVHHLNLKSLREAKANNRDRMTTPNPTLADRPTPPSPAVSPAAADDDPLADYDWGEMDGENGKIKVTLDQFNPGLVKLLRDQAKELKTLRAQVGFLTAHEGIRQDETRNQMIDRVFDSSGLERLGKGRGRDMKQLDPAFQRRLAVLAVAEKIPGEDIEARVKEAIQILYGEPVAASPSEPEPGPTLTENQRRWQAAQVARPTQRKEAPLRPGKAAAVRAVAEQLNSFGAETVNGDVDADDFPE